MTSTQKIHLIVTQQDDHGEVTVLYREAITYQLPRPCPVGISSKARTQAVLTLLRKAGLDLMVAVGAIKKPDAVQQPEGTDNEEFVDT